MKQPWRSLSISWARLLQLRRRLLLFVIVVNSHFYSTSTALATKSHSVRQSLQAPHPIRAPAETLHQLADDCHRLGISQWDVYGDFLVEEKDDSFLRQFEAEVAQECGKDDAVFMPSGVMAQSIALLIHKEAAAKEATNNGNKKNRFLCHATSHLLLHEAEGYQALCGMEAVVLPLSPLSRLDEEDAASKEGDENETPSTVVVSPAQFGRGLGASPMRYHDLLEWMTFDDQQQQTSLSHVSSLIVEMPHRELGGKLTPWEDLIKLADFCKEHQIALHCDGARLFEASTGYNKILSDLVAPFDSVYLSFYKGLGGMSGAMLCGSTSFCEQARVWLRRFGGNLYTLLPYAVSGWAGYRKYWCLEEREDSNSPTPVLTFQEKKDKLVRIVKALSDSSTITQCMSFEPSTPSTPMVHCYFRASTTLCNQARDVVLERTGVSVFHRIQALPSDQSGYAEGYRSKLEVNMGEANGNVSDHEWITSWQLFSTELLALLLPTQG